MAKLERKIIERVRECFKKQLPKKPIFGICLGHQIMAKAAGAKTYKNFWNRSLTSLV